MAMTVQERMQYCTICERRKPDFQIGITCSLTGVKPDFEGFCESFLKDEKEAERKLNLKLDGAGNSRAQYGSLKPKRNINYGIYLVIAGVITFLFSPAVGFLIFISGISFIIRGKQQKKIIKENNEFNSKLSKKE